MFASDQPPGPWGPLLVGEHWPGLAALDVLEDGVDRRRRAAADLHGYADELASIQHTHLAGQQGLTAEATRLLFSRGVAGTRAAAERNAAKRQSYESARQCVAGLRDDLCRIAEEGDAAIRAIEGSDAPTPAKISAIVEVVNQAQTQARARSAEKAGHLLATIQSVLDAQGAEVSAQAFAGSHGVDAAPRAAPAPDVLRQQIAVRLEAAAAGSGCPAAGPDVPLPAEGRTLGGTAPPMIAGTDHDSGGSAPASRPEPAGRLPGAVSAAARTLADGAVAASATGDLAATLATAAGQQPPHEAEPIPVAPQGPSAPAAETSTVTSVPVSQPAAPAAGGAPPPSGWAPRPAAAVPAGSLGGQSFSAGTPGLPASIAAPPGPAMAPQPGAATALPNHSGGSAAALGRATVIGRAAPAVPAAAERAAAVPGLPSPAARLLAVVARQQPALRWAVGERTDGSALLVTDLAGGWIPPGIVVPDGLTLPDPAPPGPDLAGLLGAAPVLASYQPGQDLPGGEQSPPGSRPRLSAPAEALGWALARATKWRDGLPRLAHTLARATTGGTGWLASEAGLLREQVEDLGARVLRGYPDAEPSDIANWQLLATIDALLDGEKDVAAYHFAWFQAAEEPESR